MTTQIIRDTEGVITPDDNNNLSTVVTPNGVKSCVIPTPAPLN